MARVSLLKYRWVWISPIRYMEACIRFARETYKWDILPITKTAYADEHGDWYIASGNTYQGTPIGIPVKWAFRQPCVEYIKRRSVIEFAQWVVDHRRLFEKYKFTPPKDGFYKTNTQMDDALDAQLGRQIWMHTHLVGYVQSCISLKNDSPGPGEFAADDEGGWVSDPLRHGIPVDWASRCETIDEVVKAAPIKYVEFMKQKLQEGEG